MAMSMDKATCLGCDKVIGLTGGFGQMSVEVEGTVYYVGWCPGCAQVFLQMWRRRVVDRVAVELEEAR